ncbi:hypothetical protein TEA_016839 [Camellia sinensis var. sinensis]|uniref:Uncharacterized protein n=1 Tax=Camellia sinensis var. sinensis TaxID=542762 RepID=A0A4S4D002_CAMSN|nr:hypothetical protein TEA_016839 [Camellia sinensis var. sinensis]
MVSGASISESSESASVLELINGAASRLHPNPFEAKRFGFLGSWIRTFSNPSSNREGSGLSLEAFDACEFRKIVLGLLNNAFVKVIVVREFCGAFGLRFHPHDGNEATKSSRSLDNGLDSEGVQAAFMQSLFFPNVCCYPARVLPATEAVVCDILRWTTARVLPATEVVVCDILRWTTASEQQILAVGTRRECRIRVGGVSKEYRCPTRTRHGYVAFLEVSVLLSSVSSPVVKPNNECKYEPIMGGISFLHWDECGYRLYPDQERSSDRIIAFSFGKCCLNRGVLGTTYIRQVICVKDRLLIVQSEDANELKILHLNLPVMSII